MEEVKRMDKYIIKASGNINEVLTALRTLQAVYGGMTLTEIDKAIRYTHIHTAINRQFQGGK